MGINKSILIFDDINYNLYKKYSEICKQLSIANKIIFVIDPHKCQSICLNFDEIKTFTKYFGNMFDCINIMSEVLS